MSAELACGTVCRARRRWVDAAALLLAIAFCTLYRPLSLTLNGTRQFVPYGASVSQAARAAGLPTVTGSLLDVTGGVLKAGGGQPAVFLLNRQVSGPEARLHRGDELWVVPGGNAVEPFAERAQLLAADLSGGGAPPGTVGIRRVQEGRVSGKTNVEISQTLPSAPSGVKPKRMALTFDDGPWPTTTAAILSTLKAHGARATFFVLGNLVRQHPDLIRRELDQDCEIGLHTWNHTDVTHLGASAIRADLGRCEQYLRGLIPEPVRLMRPPYGAINAAARGAIESLGYRVVLWTADTNDWKRPGANVVCQRILAGARNGAVVLCHDGGGPREGTVAAVQRAVPTLQERGYELVTVSELLGLGGTGGIVVTAGGVRFRVEPAVAGLRVLINGEPVTLPLSPVEINHHLLLPLKPTCDLLGLKYEYDVAAQVLTLHGVKGLRRVRFNNCEVELEDGTHENWPVPPILYQDHAMLPLWPLLEATGATMRYDPATKTLYLLSTAGLIMEKRIGRAAPPPWALTATWASN
jgi:peptidoglycan-N-acetylglucosamine deacetylase